MIYLKLLTEERLEKTYGKKENRNSYEIVRDFFVFAGPLYCSIC